MNTVDREEFTFASLPKNLEEMQALPEAGLDSPRPLKLRQKGDGRWFLWEQYLLTAIRQPKAEDPWA